jgi:hypothetical protein
MATMYCVSILNSPDDDGHTVTFEDRAAAEDLAAYARAHGCWHVVVWTA